MQNASTGRKTHTPAKPDKNETRPESTPAAYTIPSLFYKHSAGMSRAKEKEIVRFAPKYPPGFWETGALTGKAPFSLTISCLRVTMKRPICGHGGIGRLGGFRFHCESVQVRVLLPAPKQYNPNQFFLSGRWVRIICFLREVRGDQLPKRRCQAAGIQAKRLIKDKVQ